ncbi:hypothetical protein HD_0424 [[Haemophilus] ducreyi 35000HP]|uniref:Uncharacterized protein n=1 Tax=Haemophilus ducreyi (strain 35000HP / ATCC 700724) TaxID=233412 RepID=Q7VNR3_HAEDU|nr:hypothetical protein HD_0424 [[Haemophilus] ducreyi 35000HP]
MVFYLFYSIEKSEFSQNGPLAIPFKVGTKALAVVFFHKSNC